MHCFDALTPIEEAQHTLNEFVREGSGTIEFKGQTLHVKRQEGDTSRQPTLELRTTDVTRFHLPGTTPAISPSPVPVPDVAPQPNDWYSGFLREIDELFGCKEFECVMAAEKSMLKVVAEELAAFREKPAQELALVLLTSILLTADHLSRTQHPGKSSHYAIALNGIERLLTETTLTRIGRT